ncbi:MAG: hypothetical protein IK141_07440 [Clostridia bacterium]|nr:hypothetical protein [Clostridia bacterium]
MAKGRYVKRREGMPPAAILALCAVALAAVIFAGSALVRAHRNKPVDTPPDPAMSNPADPGTPTPVDPTKPPVETDDVVARRASLLEEAASLYERYFYDEAIALLEQAGELKNTETAALLQDVRQAKDALVKYDSAQYYHIFFHSLIVDPSLAFDGDYQATGYDQYMTTVSEFKAMLPLLEEEGYILYDITQLAERADGKTRMKEIWLPEGKKPLVISIDDVNYYDYMKGDGFADRLDVDAEGNVVTIVNGEATYDGDVMPILDAYVKEHPAFSWQGAKGVVAITGYAGAFGYRITDLPDYDEQTQKWMLEKTEAVAKALRTSGWQIACHSYTHNQYWNKKTITMEQEQYDIGRWLGEIAPYVGDTPIFISPFGVFFEADDARFRYLVDHGFWIYCPVDSRMPAYCKNDFFIQGRINLDGLTMKHYPERISRFFFDPAKVLDPARPK